MGAFIFSNFVGAGTVCYVPILGALLMTLVLSQQQSTKKKKHLHGKGENGWLLLFLQCTIRFVDKIPNCNSIS